MNLGELAQAATLKVGDRIKLLELGFDPFPLSPGETGAVTHVQFFPGEAHVSVRWDSGRTLAVILPHDRIEILGDAWEAP